MSETSEKLTWRRERSVERDRLFSVFLCFLTSYKIVKDVARKSVAFQVLAMNLLCRNVVQNARKRAQVQKCMGSVILQFSTIKKVEPQNV